jgi:hypothetical protein
MDRKTLINATLVGTILQLVMVVTGHFIPAVKDHIFAVGGMAISLLAGLNYARRARGGWGSSLVGGAIAGGVCALIGILVSAALHDVELAVVAFGTGASIVTGLVGGAVGRLVARQPTAPL